MYPKNTVADVLRLEVDHLEALTNTSWHESTLHAIIKCRTKALGGHLDWCRSCNKLHLQFNSCHNIHCPTCQGHKQQQWIEARTLIKKSSSLIIKWSIKSIPTNLPSCINFFVSFLTSCHGCKFPQGWLWQRIIRTALFSTANPKTAIGSTSVAVVVPNLLIRLIIYYFYSTNLLPNNVRGHDQ